MSPEQDPLEERIRAALEARAEDAQPRGDGLDRIRTRVAHRRRLPFLAHPALAAVGSAGVLVIAVSAAAAGVGKIPGTPPWAKSGSESASTSDHGGSNASASSTSSTGPTKNPPSTHKTPGGTKDTGGQGDTHKAKQHVNVPVYYLARSGESWSLQKTDRNVTVHGNPSEQDRAEAAIDAMLHDTGSYSNPWQAGTTVVDASLSASTLTVDLSSAAGSGSVSDGEAAQAALRQLVYTGTAAAPSASTVRVTVGGQPTTRFWGWVPVSSSGIGRGDPALTAPLNLITAPASGASVAAPVTIGGSGTYGSATVAWQVTQNGSVVKSGNQSTGTSGFTKWSTTVDLEPGTYTLRTYDSHASGDQNQQTVGFTVSGSPSTSAS